VEGQHASAQTFQEEATRRLLRYFVQIGKRQIPLGRDRDEAYRKYHELMAGRQPVTDETTCATLFDQFLTWTERNRAAPTYDWYRGHL
jgi:integrase/recombinase XerC